MEQWQEALKLADQAPRCGAKTRTRNGEPCQAPAMAMVVAVYMAVNLQVPHVVKSMEDMYMVNIPRKQKKETSVSIGL